MSLVVAVVFPLLPYFKANQFLLVLVLIYALIGVSLTMLVGWAGQVSLGQFAVVGIGAYVTAKWAGESGWSMVELLVVAGLVGAFVMVAIGLPALRVRGLTLAVTTLGLAVIGPDWLYQQGWLGGSTPFNEPVQAMTVLPGFGFIGSQLSLYYVALVVLVLVMAAAATLRRSAVGRTIIAVRDNERAVSSFGIKPVTVKLRVLGALGLRCVFGRRLVRGRLAERDAHLLRRRYLDRPLGHPRRRRPRIAGRCGRRSGAPLHEHLLYRATPEQPVGLYRSERGVLPLRGRHKRHWLHDAVPQRHRRPGSRVVAGPPQQEGRTTHSGEKRQTHLPIESLPPSADLKDAVPVTGTAIERAAASVSFATIGRHEDGGKRGERATTTPVAGALPLVVDGVAVHFGGIAALRDASIEVPPGEIVGLIGPNGAGKTTLMNTISGVIRPDQGSIRLFGHEVARRSPDVRARYGLARSFQDASLFAGLTVTETVQVATSRRVRTLLLPAMVGAPWVRSAERDSRRRALEIVEAFGLGPWADALTSELSTGMRRICDLAAQVATEPRLLLLDEPTAGVAQREAEAFAPLVRRIRDDLDCAILIIEHDMPMLMGLCDRVYAMDAGSVIAKGTPEDIRENPLVIASYLGTNTTAISRSGQTVTT